MAHFLMKVVLIALTVFYGQFLAVGLYHLIIEGVFDIVFDKDNVNKYYFHIGRIILGLFVVLVSLISLFFMWLRKYKILFVCAGLVTLILFAYVALYTVYLVFNFNDLTNTVKYTLIAQCGFQALFMFIGSAFTFLLAARGPYTLLKKNDYE